MRSVTWSWLLEASPSLRIGCCCARHERMVAPLAAVCVWGGGSGPGWPGWDGCEGASSVVTRATCRVYAQSALQHPLPCLDLPPPPSLCASIASVSSSSSHTYIHTAHHAVNNMHTMQWLLLPAAPGSLTACVHCSARQMQRHELHALPLLLLPLLLLPEQHHRCQHPILHPVLQPRQPSCRSHSHHVSRHHEWMCTYHWCWTICFLTFYTCCCSTCMASCPHYGQRTQPRCSAQATGMHSGGAGYKVYVY